MLISEENQLAKSLGFTAHPDAARSGNCCKFSNGSIWVWEAVLWGLLVGWVRAEVVGNRYTGYKRYRHLEDALLDKSELKPSDLKQ